MQRGFPARHGTRKSCAAPARFANFETSCQTRPGQGIVCAANAGVLRCASPERQRAPHGVGEKYPLNLIWIMPAQGSVRARRFTCC